MTVWGYLRRFLFADDRINTRVKRLSGGERARLALAKILRGGGNFLILDEPTNDLDLATLRILEEALIHYDGCLAVVSHDRYFLNRVCTHILAFEPDGTLSANVGDYDAYYAKKQEKLSFSRPETAAAPVKNLLPPQPKNKPKSGLTYKEDRDIETLEIRISELENEIAREEAHFSDPEFFRTRASEAGAVQKRIDALKAEYETACSRWEELESKRI